MTLSMLRGALLMALTSGAVLAFNDDCAAKSNGGWVEGFTASNGISLCWQQNPSKDVIGFNPQYKADFNTLANAMQGSDACCGDCETIGCPEGSGLYKVNGCSINSGGHPYPFPMGLDEINKFWDEVMSNNVEIGVESSPVIFGGSYTGDPNGFTHQINLGFANDGGNNC